MTLFARDWSSVTDLERYVSHRIMQKSQRQCRLELLRRPFLCGKDRKFFCKGLAVRQWQVIRWASPSWCMSTHSNWVGCHLPPNTAILCQGQLDLGILSVLLLISCSLLQQWKLSICSWNFSWSSYISDEFLIKSALNGHPYLPQGKVCF